MSARLFVVDGPGYLYRAYHALPYLSNSKGQPSNAVFGMSTMLWKLLRDESPEYAAVAWDPPGPTFREAKLPSYKETRPGMPDDLRSQIALVMRVFEALRLPLLEVPGFEADDVLGTLVERMKGEPVEMVLVTSDKDMLQLVSPRVRVLSANARGEPVWYDEAAVTAKWGVTPEQIPDLLALMGDSILACRASARRRPSSSSASSAACRGSTRTSRSCPASFARRWPRIARRRFSRASSPR